MADVKISALPLASTPLAGTEVLPIVQSATTDQVTVANLTAGRAVSASSLTLTTTPLAVGSGGTGLSSLTAGRIPFGAGVSGTDPFGNDSNLVWNNTDKNLSIGAATPAANQKLLVSGGRSGFFANSEPYSLYVQYNSSTNGVYLGSPSANAFQISNAGGSSLLNLDASGNLGLGVTPSTWSAGKAIEIGNLGNSVWAVSQTQFVITNNAYYNGTYKYASSNAASNYEQINGAHKWYYAASGTIGNTITFTQAMTLDASGNLGIGTATPQAKLNISNSGAAGLEFFTNFPGGGTGTYIQSYNRSGSAFVDTAYYATSHTFRTTSSTTAMTLDASGNLLVGTTSYSSSGSNGIGIGGLSSAGVANTPQAYLVGNSSTNSQNAFLIYSSGAAAYRFYVGYGGTISATNTTISGISDQRLKENIIDLDVGLDAILALKPRKFDWKTGKGKDIKGDRGFIAQEIEEVFPDLIDEWIDTPPEGEAPYKSVRQDLVPVLVKAIQELAAKVAELEAKI